MLEGNDIKGDTPFMFNRGYQPIKSRSPDSVHMIVARRMRVLDGSKTTCDFRVFKG